MAVGIAQVLRKYLGRPILLDAFTKAVRFKTMLEQVSVYEIMGEATLLGAASWGLRLFPSAAKDATRPGTRPDTLSSRREG